MTVYIAGRQTGKTVFLIQQSARTGAVIVAPTYQMVGYIDRMARDLGLQIPPPITVADWIRGLVRQREDRDKTYLVDELQMVLNQLNVETATLDENYKEMVRMFGVKETCCKLLYAIFDICELADFEIEGRIVLVDKRSGKVWR